MTADIIKFGDVVADHKFCKAVFEARVKGMSVRRIAEDFDCTIDQVEHAIITATGAVSPQIRQQYLKLNMERLDRLIGAAYDEALAGSYQQAVIYLRTVSMQCSLLGLFPPANTPPPENDQPVQTTTDEIEAALDFVRKSKNRTIDGEVIEETDDGA